MVAPPEEVSFMVELSITTPSTTYKGWLLNDRELKPRNTTEEEAPAIPEVGSRVKPATRPCRPLIKFSRCVS